MPDVCEGLAMYLDLKRLDTFRLVARFGSLSRVAAQRGLTVPAVSIQIKNLETELGVKLFDHRPNRVTLTHHGRLLLKEANELLDSAVRVKEAITKPAHGYEGNVMVSVATDLGRLFAPKVAAFVDQHPNLNVTILARRTRESIALVMSGEIDMAVGFFPRVPRGIIKTAITDTAISLVVPRSHPLARKTSPTLAEVFAFRVVARRLLLDDASLTWPSQLHLPNLIAVDTCQLALDFAEFGQGVGLVHDACANFDPRKKLRLIDMTRYFAATNVSLIARSGAVLSPAAQALMHALAESSSHAKRGEISLKSNPGRRSPI
jgi:DNA-binding transcriptional LysR family regulator